MKIVHTSDWHVGRRWKGIQRQDEMEAVLDNLSTFIEKESIDLILHTGDIFDSRNPPADADRLVNEFFLRVGKAGARMVVIAGNHDDPRRLDARGLLTRFANVEMLGEPRSAADGGVLNIEAGGERAIVAALPFASAGRWVSAMDLVGKEAEARSKYARMFQLAMTNLCQGFDAGAVNLVMAHTHLEGAVFGESERRVHIGEDWAATPQTLPTEASYIALGHIHKPQKMPGALPAYYAGSPLQLDFGEVGQEKSFVLVNVKAGNPAQIERIPYEGGKSLQDVAAALEDLSAQADSLRDEGWLRVTVQLKERDPDISRKVRELLPNTLVVRVDLPQEEVQKTDRPPAGASAKEHYTAYHLREHGSKPEARVIGAFEELYEQSSEAS